jgi:AcrR family transcriptional regulator
VVDAIQASGAGVRGQLSRERIIRATIEVIERDGEDAVSMRRIAAELGSGVMSLYNHVPNKDALLDAVAEYVLADFRAASDAHGADADWRDQARTLVRLFRTISRRYPRCITVVIMRQLNSATGLHPLESALATARAAGFDGELAVRIMRTFVSYALGTLVNEARLTRMQAAGVDVREYATRMDVRQFPHIVDLADTLAHVNHEADFEFGLELLINAVSALPRDALPREALPRDDAPSPEIPVQETRHGAKRPEGNRGRAESGHGPPSPRSTGH